MNEFFNSFFEIGYSSTRSCQQQRQKTKKNQRKFVKKRSSQKLENQRSWNFAGFISQQNASKKRLGSCSIPGSTSGSRSRAWTLSKKIASNCCFLPLKIEEKLRKKARLKHRKIRRNRIKLLFFTFEKLYSVCLPNWCGILRRTDTLVRQHFDSGSRSRAWTKTFFWCILKRDKDSKNPGFPFSFENCSFTSL